MMIDGRNGVEKMRGKRNVAREKVESSNECFGVLLLVLFLLFIHGYGGRERYRESATVPFSITNI
jgi:hypothetical protein